MHATPACWLYHAALLFMFSWSKRAQCQRIFQPNAGLFSMNLRHWPWESIWKYVLKPSGVFGGISTPFGGTPSPSSGELRHLISLSSSLLFSFFSDFLFLCCHFLRHKKRERGAYRQTQEERERWVGVVKWPPMNHSLMTGCTSVQQIDLMKWRLFYSFSVKIFQLHSLL